MLHLRFALFAALLLASYSLARPQDASANTDDQSTSTEATTVASADLSADATTVAAVEEATTAAVEEATTAASDSATEAGANDASANAGASAGGSQGGYLPIGDGGSPPPPPQTPSYPGGSSVATSNAAAGGAGGRFPGFPGGTAGGASSFAGLGGGPGGYNPFAGLGGGIGGGFNPFALLFSFYRPPHAPHVHQGGGIYINSCTACSNYGDATDEMLTDELACMNVVDTETEKFLTPDELKKKVDQLNKDKPGDIKAPMLQCCYKEYAEKIAKNQKAPKSINVKSLKYPDLEGLEKGKTCKDMVHSFYKLLKGDYPTPPKGAQAKAGGKAAESTAKADKKVLGKA